MTMWYTPAGPRPGQQQYTPQGPAPNAPVPAGEDVHHLTEGGDKWTPSDWMWLALALALAFALIASKVF